MKKKDFTQAEMLWLIQVREAERKGKSTSLASMLLPVSRSREVYAKRAISGLQKKGALLKSTRLNGNLVVSVEAREFIDTRK